MSDLYLELVELGFSVDLRHAGLSAEALASSAAALEAALDEMVELEAGAVANADEGRQVGHYWLRAPERAPDTLGAAIVADHERRAELAVQVARRYTSLVHVGVGGSSLGAQLLVDALGASSPKVTFLDNLDPQGLARTTADLEIEDAAVVVVSKSGTTAEVDVALGHIRERCRERELALAPRAIAVTCEGSALHQEASDDAWRGRLSLWPWLGGRTSIFSSAGLLTAQISGVDVAELLEGARLMDEHTRSRDLSRNPAALLALCWQRAQDDRPRSMVVLPYRDGLRSLGRYLQQLVMESLGKASRRGGARAPHGLTVFGNKGTTDQHAIVQQLRDGPDDCFVTFVEALSGVDAAPGSRALRAEDLLSGFAYGTRAALHEVGRRTVTLSLSRLDARGLGALVALFERAVGLYATLEDINAYDQPGVEAGKRGATDQLHIQAAIEELLERGENGDASHFAALVERDAGRVFHVLRHLAHTGRAVSTGVGIRRRFSAS